jgi:hypothetical protein
VKFLNSSIQDRGDGPFATAAPSLIYKHPDGVGATSSPSDTGERRTPLNDVADPMQSMESTTWARRRSRIDQELRMRPDERARREKPEPHYPVSPED